MHLYRRNGSHIYNILLHIFPAIHACFITFYSTIRLQSLARCICNFLNKRTKSLTLSLVDILSKRIEYFRTLFRSNKSRFKRGLLYVRIPYILILYCRRQVETSLPICWRVIRLKWGIHRIRNTISFHKSSTTRSFDKIIKDENWEENNIGT